MTTTFFTGPRARIGEVPLPQVPRGLRAEAGVDEREAVAVGEDPQVDVVERERQRHADPPHPGGDLEGLAGLRDALPEGVGYLVVQTQVPFHAGPGVFARKCSTRFRYTLYSLLSGAA